MSNASIFFIATNIVILFCMLFWLGFSQYGYSDGGYGRPRISQTIMVGFLYIYVPVMGLQGLFAGLFYGLKWWIEIYRVKY